MTQNLSYVKHETNVYFIGRLGGGQTLNLQSPDCLKTIGTPIHELLHAAGFMHEQNREERDAFVNVRFNNVEPGREKNFEKTRKGESSNFGVAYDFGSVMHYSHVAFSKNGKQLYFPTVNFFNEVF